MGFDVGVPVREPLRAWWWWRSPVGGAEALPTGTRGYLPCIIWSGGIGAGITPSATSRP